ncbi:MAG: crossover junction endodeoxyribonuclease RuvC [Patescibacteria group bacterium]
MKNKNPQIILGIDPGYDRVGYCLAQILNSKLEILDFGCIQTNKQNSLTQRYQETSKNLNKIIKKYKPNILAIETVLFSVNKKTAMRVAEAKGVITQICLTNNLEIFEYNPNQIKLAITGNGKADKKAVEKMLKLELKLPNKKTLDDAMDAIAIAQTHYLVNPKPAIV